MIGVIKNKFFLILKKYLIFFKKFLIIAIAVLFLIEFFSFFFLKFDNTELFKIRDLTEKTNDKRYFTLKKNYSSEFIHFKTKKNWSIISSNERLRISKFDNKITNYLAEDNFDEKFLFLGDSVPFGWGVNAEYSLPYIFKQNNKKLSVLNGALPSYSLAQAVERYEKEFVDLKNLKFIFLQVYSPVTEYSLYGTKWDESYNWSNLPEKLLEQYSLKKINLPFYGEPYFYDYLRKKIYRIFINKKMDKNEKFFNDKSDQKFVNYINFNLEKIYNLIDNKKVFLIISSTNINNFSNKSPSLLRVLEKFNKSLEEFSLINDRVYYFDVSAEINLKPKKMFIDSCCHLSEIGANLTALELTKFIKSLK